MSCGVYPSLCTEDQDNVPVLGDILPLPTGIRTQTLYDGPNMWAGLTASWNSLSVKNPNARQASFNEVCS